MMCQIQAWAETDRQLTLLIAFHFWQILRMAGCRCDENPDVMIEFEEMLPGGEEGWPQPNG